MSKQVEKIKELVAKREQARLAVAKRLLRSSMHAANTLHVNVLKCLSTKARLRSMTCSRSIVAQTSAWRRSTIMVMVLLPVAQL